MAGVSSTLELKHQKNSQNILNDVITFQSCGTNTEFNFMCNNCERRNEINNWPPYLCSNYPVFPSHFPSSRPNYYKYEDTSAPSEQYSSNCQSSKQKNDYFQGSNCNECHAIPNLYGGSFIQPFPIYMPFYCNPTHIFPNIQTYSPRPNCTQCSQTDSVQNHHEDTFNKKLLPKLNYKSPNEIEDQYSNKSNINLNASEDNRPHCQKNNIVKQNIMCDDFNDSIDETVYDDIDPPNCIRKDKFIRICEDKNSYYEIDKQLEEKNSNLKYEGNLNGDELKYYSATSLHKKLDNFGKNNSLPSKCILDELIAPTKIESNESIELHTKVTRSLYDGNNSFESDELDEFDENELDDQNVDTFIEDNCIDDEITKEKETQKTNDDVRCNKNGIHPKFCPPQMDSVQSETAALCMLSLLTRRKPALEKMPQMKIDGGRTSIFKKPFVEVKEKNCDSYSAPVRNNVHKLPNALQQNDILKSANSPRPVVKLRKNPNLNMV